jgi:polyhydroxyalkanoate synthesis regulator phasin
MEKDQEEYKNFLEQQLHWCKEHDRILEEINIKLHDMKKIAEYTLAHELTSAEIDKLNGELNQLKREVHFLEKQLYSVVH